MTMQESELERLNGLLERLEQLLGAASAVGPIVATVESAREAELEHKLAEAEATIAELRAVGPVASGRKTLPVGMVSLLAKQGLAAESMDAGALDAALGSLSIEQRIAVKAEMMRAGLLG